MCGIAGIISLSDYELSEKDSHRLTKMLTEMYHRGPDGEGKKIFPSCYFGMRRLAIIDLEGGQQPISNETEDVWVVMNGELYNYIELREELLKKGHRFKTHSDTEVVVHLYEEYGKEFVSKLNGMFAIFLYDQKNEKKFLFRDHIGIKPLFYTHFEGRFIFSSDLTGLRSIVDSKLCKDSVLSYLGLSYIPKPASIYEGIYKLMPGSAIQFDNDKKISHYQFWSTEINTINDISFEEAKQKLHNLMEDACTIQLRSDADFAISLSGGVDSSAVLAFASQGYSKKLNTISIGYEGKTQSMDVSYAQLMANRYHTNHLNINLKSDHFMEYLDEIIPKIDEPIADSALIPNYIISKEARKLGIKVLLSGAGGDELFGGYHRHLYPSLYKAQGLVLYPKALRMLGYYLLNSFKMDNNIERLKHPRLSFSSTINGLNYSFLLKVIQPELYKSLISKTVDHYSDINYSRDGFEQRAMLNDTKNYLVDNILSLSDKATMAASIEGRFPIIDYRIVKFAFSLPKSYIFYKNEPKGILKEILKPYVFSDILFRKKEGFNAPIQQWFGSEKVNEIKKYLIRNVKEKLSDIINPVALENTLDFNNTNSFENIYNLYFLNKWIDQHVK